MFTRDARCGCLEGGGCLQVGYIRGRQFSSWLNGDRPRRALHTFSFKKYVVYSTHTLTLGDKRHEYRTQSEEQSTCFLFYFITCICAFVCTTGS